MMTDSLYREEILEHYREPMNFGKPEQFDTSSKQVNPFCGDEIEMFIKWESAGVNGRHPKGVIVSDVGFEGKGCAVSVAAASMLTEHAKGKDRKQLTKFLEQDMLKLLNIEVSETRKKCALLALYVFRDCLYAIQGKS